MRTVTEVAIHNDGDSPVFGESVTRVRLEDDAGGAFLVVSQEDRELRLDYDKLVDIIESAKWLLDQQGVKCGE